MMLLAGLSAIAASVWHQTAMLLWELAIGGPILIVAAVAMLRLRGGWRFLGALLAAGPAAWAVWQLATYVPLLPDFVAASWPIFCFMPIAAVLAILATLRCWRSVFSNAWILVPGQPPRRRHAVGGIVFATLVVGLIAGVGFAPDELRRPAMMALWGRAPAPTAAKARTPSAPSRQIEVNPVLPPMNSSQPTAPARPAASTPSQPATRSDPPPAPEAARPVVSLPLPATPAKAPANPPARPTATAPARVATPSGPTAPTPPPVISSAAPPGTVGVGKLKATEPPRPVVKDADTLALEQLLDNPGKPK